MCGVRFTRRNSSEYVLENAGTTVWAVGVWGAGPYRPHMPGGLGVMDANCTAYSSRHRKE